MAFRRGDIVIYEHTKAGKPEFNGALGIVVDDGTGPGLFRVKWISFNSVKDAEVREMPHSWNVRKIGHLDDF